MNNSLAKKQFIDFLDIRCSESLHIEWNFLIACLSYIGFDLNSEEYDRFNQQSCSCQTLVTSRTQLQEQKTNIQCIKLKAFTAILYCVPISSGSIDSLLVIYLERPELLQSIWPFDFISNQRKIHPAQAIKYLLLCRWLEYFDCGHEPAAYFSKIGLIETDLLHHLDKQQTVCLQSLQYLTRTQSIGLDARKN